MVREVPGKFAPNLDEDSDEARGRETQSNGDTTTLQTDGAIGKL